MQTVDWVFQFRWVLWGVTPLIVIPLLKQIRSSQDVSKVALKWKFEKTLLILCICFFCLASISKYSQYKSLSLSAQDFWLFEDMLRQMSSGGAFLTRFAPQAIGWVQHGMVHPFFTWFTALPLSLTLGPVAAALLYMPLLFAGAGFILGIICLPRWGEFKSLLIVVSFLVSSQVGRILTYEVHPEAAYPFFIFLWYWAAGWSDGEVRFLSLALATLGGLWIKEDAFLVFFPFIFFSFLFSPPNSRRRLAYAMSGAIALAALAFQFYAVRQWRLGDWGPRFWNGSPVILPQPPHFLKGYSWDSPLNAFQIFKTLLDQSQGGVGVLKKCLQFVMSRPWLSLGLIAPWVYREWSFWFVLGPLILITALLGEPMVSLVNYYGAPFVGLFWIWAVCFPKVRGAFSRHAESPSKLLWILIISFVFGSGGLSFSIPSPWVKTIHDEVSQLRPCLSQAVSPGWVATQLIPLVPQEKIWTERRPSQEFLETQIGFVMLLPKTGSYELPLSSVQKTLEELANHPNWTRCGQTQEVVMYIKNGMSNKAQ